MAGSFMHEMLGAELGFLDKQSERWRLESRHFPSKGTLKILTLAPGFCRIKQCFENRDNETGQKLG